MTKFYYIYIISPILLLTLISIIFTPILEYSSQSNLYTLKSSSISLNHIPTLNLNSTNSLGLKLLWPIPGYTKITSKFGYRKAPTTGASKYHGGIDIAAPEGASIISVADGKISFIGWNGANGYTVIVTHSNNIKSIYGHVSPNFLVSTGSIVKKGEIIAKVGPKYISKTNYTTYTDNTGRYTNGATTRSTFALFNKQKQ